MVARRVGRGRITTQPPYWSPVRICLCVVYAVALLTVFLTL